jgi:hypothetical protein
MIDWPMITGALQSIKAARAIADYMAKVQKDYDTTELKLKISELVDALLDTQSKIAEAGRALEEKQNDIDHLKDALAFKDKLVFAKGVYYVADANNQPIGDPYCPGCWDAHREAIHLHSHPAKFHTLECPVCKTTYPNGRKPSGPLFA